jgi:hypothetical protein
LLVGAACGGGANDGRSGNTGGGGADAGGDPVADGGTSTGGGTDAGSDAGTGSGSDAGTGSGSDAGTGGGQDGGTGGGSDGGTDAGTIVFPTPAGWQFYGPQHGGPQEVYDAAMDEGGNLWVAGGAEGLFVLRRGEGTFQKFGIADGLHPYGYLNGEVARSKGVPDGSPADPSPSLAATPVISVSGGPAGTVFVGYQGKPGCEDAWKWLCAEVKCTQTDSNGKCTHSVCSKATSSATWGDPAVYKSGDADRVTLAGSGISAVHYDIFSGPDVVEGELGGREKICTVYRIVWDKAQDKVWFGGNHGFAMGKASYAGSATCNGEYDGYLAHPDCTGVWEHSHPAISGCSTDTVGGSCNNPIWLTDSYFGIGLDRGDVWFGGYNRSTVFHYGTYGGNNTAGAGLEAYYAAGANDTEWSPQGPGYCTNHNPNGARFNGVPCGADNRLDIWKDNLPECTGAANSPACNVNYLGPSDRKDDAVSGIVPEGGGKAWVSSFANGLVLVNEFGDMLGDATAKLLAKNVSALAGDPGDGSLWAGMRWGLGITRYNPATGSASQLDYKVFGVALANDPIGNIQVWGAGPARKMVVSFSRSKTAPGAVGVYSGP